VRARFPSPQAFASALERSGITEAQLREISRDNLRIRAYVGQRFAGAENEARRLTLVDEWVAGLRKRSDIIDLYANRTLIRFQVSHKYFEPRATSPEAPNSTSGKRKIRQQFDQIET